ncbi:Kinase [Hexamita inflata]|uniref:non-specific serine/threonine protein kinase n=1 Tax=Hexamita inflata TaxID=28002 RepID=A0AA86UQL5_9EUKA|nr:Kinase [Hexamita inflata]
MESEQVIQSSITQTQYKLIKNIGSGTYAQCWSALNIETNIQVCLKFVDYYLMDENQQESARREAQLHVTLLNDCIIRFLETFFHSTDSGQIMLVIVMELGECSLDSFLAEHSNYFSPQQLLQFVQDIVQALRYLHAREIIHRDLSTKNLLVFSQSNQLRLKICDFGVSTALPKSHLANTQIGTPHTMSPEIFDAQGYDERADIWAAGCVCFELFTRVALFKGLNYLALIKELEKFTEPQFPTSTEKVYSVMFCAFVMELICLMLKVDPKQRPSAKQIELLIKKKKEAETADFWDWHELNHQEEPEIDVEEVKEVWIDHDGENFTVNSVPPSQPFQKPPQKEKLEIKIPDVKQKEPVETPTKQQKKGLSISEMRKQYKGKTSKSFEVEIFTGLSPEVEEQMNQRKK